MPLAFPRFYAASQARTSLLVLPITDDRVHGRDEGRLTMERRGIFEFKHRDGIPLANPAPTQRVRASRSGPERR